MLVFFSFSLLLCSHLNHSSLLLCFLVTYCPCKIQSVCASSDTFMSCSTEEEVEDQTCHLTHSHITWTLGLFFHSIWSVAETGFIGHNHYDEKDIKHQLLTQLMVVKVHKIYQTGQSLLLENYQFQFWMHNYSTFALFSVKLSNCSLRNL